MFSYDEFDQSFQSESTAGPLDGPKHHQHLSTMSSLALELESALQDESYGTDDEHGHAGTMNGTESHSDFFTSDYSKNCTTLIGDYSGDEWGDPAEDSDPDGRFYGLDVAIETLVSCASRDLDSAYMSSEDDSDFVRRRVNTAKTDAKHDCDAISRLTLGLQNLPTQDVLEAGVSANILSNTALASELANHMIELKDLVQHLTPYHFGRSRDTEDLDMEVLPMLDALIRLLPEESTSIYDELSLLAGETNALVADLALLSDSLQETRQISNIAQRSLRSAKDHVEEWKREIHEVDCAREWLDINQSEHKLTRRSVTRELLNLRHGFEEVCDAARKRIEQHC